MHQIRWTVTHRKQIGELSCIKISVTNTHARSGVSVSGIVKNDELKWSRRHTIDTIPDDWRQKTDSKWNRRKKSITCCCCCCCYSRIDGFESKRFIKNWILFAFRAVAFLLVGRIPKFESISEKTIEEKLWKQAHRRKYTWKNKNGKNDENLLWISGCMCAKTLRMRC